MDEEHGRAVEVHPEPRLEAHVPNETQSNESDASDITNEERKDQLVARLASNARTFVLSTDNMWEVGFGIWV